MSLLLPSKEHLVEKSSDIRFALLKCLTNELNRQQEYRLTGDDRAIVPSGSLDLDKVRTETILTTKEEVEATSSWSVKAIKHAGHIINNPDVFLPVFALETSRDVVEVKAGGLSVAWKPENIVQMYAIKADYLKQATPAPFTYETNETYSQYSLWLRDPVLTDSYIGDATKGTTLRAWAWARRNALYSSSYIRGDIRTTDEGLHFTLSVRSGLLDYRQVLLLQDLYRTYHSKLPASLIANSRAHVQDVQRQVQAREETIKQQLANKKFSIYWDTMKSRIRESVPRKNELHEQFATIPLLPEGTTTPRTWGIEVETVRAHMTSKPSGWHSVYDGSLHGSDGSCECGCDSCYDGDHCENHSNDCYNDTELEGREFVSPILSHYNSRGLRQLCSDLPDREEDDSPGIHVHVGALDLSVTDVARLVASYSTIAPFLQPLYHRQTDEYCRETATEFVQWWLGAARKYLRDTGRVPEPRHICDDNRAGRYLDVNVTALAKHGTIEFRAMGPYYNYDHLVRWAWLVRELVNVSKLGLPLNTWTRCKSLTDVIKVLRIHGAEIPINRLDEKLDTSQLALALSEE